MKDLENKPPNARLLGPSAEIDDPDLLNLDVNLHEFEISAHPFTELTELTVRLDFNSSLPLGFAFTDCARLHRAFINRIDRPATSMSLSSFRRSFLGSYIVAVNGVPTFTSASVSAVLKDLQSLESCPSTVTIVLAPERKADLADDRGAPLHLRLHDLRHICAIRSVPDHTTDSKADIRTAVATYESLMSDSELVEFINRLQTERLHDSGRTSTSQLYSQTSSTIVQLG